MEGYNNLKRKKKRTRIHRHKRDEYTQRQIKKRKIEIYERWRKKYTDREEKKGREIYRQIRKTGTQKGHRDKRKSDTHGEIKEEHTQNGQKEREIDRDKKDTHKNTC